MGSNRQTPEGDGDAPDPEKILEFARTARKAPEFIPRSRCLDDLPGGIRVPILLKPAQRLNSKLQENLAGLEELKLLKEKQQLLVDSAKNLTPTKNNQTQDNSEVDRRSLRSPRRVSCNSLASISEENTNSFQINNSYSENNLMLNQSRSRQPLSISDVNHIQEEFEDTGNLLENRNGSCSSDRSSTSAEFSISSCASDEGDAFDKENRFRTVTPVQSVHKNLSLSASDGFQQSRQEFISSFVNKTNQAIGRRASVQVDSGIFRRTFVENTNKSSEDIKKLRRASMQCDAIITKPGATQNMAKLISDIKMNYDFPCPLHAVMRQYGSSSSNLQLTSEKQQRSTDNLRTNSEKHQHVSYSAPKQTKSARELVEEWQAMTKKNNSSLKNNTVDNEKNSVNETKVTSDTLKAGDLSIENNNKESSNDFRNFREQSFTSDYFGSVETIHSIMSLPNSLRQKRSIDASDGNMNIQAHLRRHSLPTTPIAVSPTRKVTDNSSFRKTLYSYEKPEITFDVFDESVSKDEKYENDVFQDEQMDCSINTDGVLNFKMDSKQSLASDEGYVPSNPSSPLIERHKLSSVSECEMTSPDKEKLKIPDTHNSNLKPTSQKHIKNGAKHQTFLKGLRETAL